MATTTMDSSSSGCSKSQMVYDQKINIQIKMCVVLVLGRFDFNFVEKEKSC